MKRKRILVILLCLLMILESFSLLCLTAFAEEETDSNTYVLDDLKRDPDFKVEDYPDDPKDLSLQVITIAESTTRELLVYVYQPAAATQPLTATSINISQSHKAIQFHNYTLTLLNQEGVFQKYKVNDFVVQNASVRYYEITNIYRLPLNESEQSTGYDDGNVINELSNPVGKGYQFTGYSDGNTSLVVEDIDFITVTDKYVGFMRYPAATFAWWTYGYLDVHFVAFSTDRKIDNLLEADVYYVQQHVGGYYEHLGSDNIVAGSTSDTVIYGEKEAKYSYLKFDESMKYQEDGWLSVDYEWKTIEKASDFLVSSGEDVSIYKNAAFESTVVSEVKEEDRALISSKEWVLRFAHTPYNTEFSATTYISYYDHYNVGEVSILRLAFETDGVYYNLGVVDNKQTGKGTPSNDSSVEFGLGEQFEKLMALLLLILVVVLLAPILPSFLMSFVIKPVWGVIKWFFKLVWKILTWPFKMIGRLLFPKK